ncbi:addiction module HigA family antidote [Duganella sp. 1411]|nr:addiction module HigA family antidote [Duganella sp. 1411]
MKPLDLTAAALAAELHISVSQVNALMSGENSVTERLAQSLSSYFKVSAQFWLNLQAEYDARTAASK